MAAGSLLPGEPGDLAGVADEAHQVRALSPDADAVGRVLSL